MSPELWLYPTETVYGLGVNPFDTTALEHLYALKARPDVKPVSWLVRCCEDIERYAELPATPRTVAAHFLPGPLTLVVPLRSEYERYGAADGTVGFRISSDPRTSAVVAEWMGKYGVPLTATSANVSGEPTGDTIVQILAQFGNRAELITRIIDDGPRTGTPSTVVRCVGEEVAVLREGAIATSEIMAVLGKG